VGGRCGQVLPGIVSAFVSQPVIDGTHATINALERFLDVDASEQITAFKGRTRYERAC